MIFRIALLLLLFASGNLYADTSKIWGKNGEKWDKSRLPDWSQVGYRKGKPIPNFAKSEMRNVVKDYGAKPDDGKDDTKAFENALKDGGKIYIPPGRYIIKKQIVLKKDGTVLHGAGEGKTRLYFPNHLYSLFGKKWDHPTHSYWSYHGGLIRIDKKASECGVEYLTMECKETPHHISRDHAKEKGYNGIQIDGTHNWVRNVTTQNMDIHYELNNQYNTLVNITLGGKRSGHKGVIFASQYCLLYNFRIKPLIKETLAFQDGSMNVAAKGHANILSFDHHRDPTHRNLFSNIRIDDPSRIYSTGGSRKKPEMHPDSRYNTFWNIHGKNGNALMGRELTRRCNIIGATRNDYSDKNHIEKITPRDLQPQDLYLAQGGRDPDSGGLVTLEPPRNLVILTTDGD